MAIEDGLDDTRNSEILVQVDICNNEGIILAKGYLWQKKGGYIELRGESFPLFDQGEKLKVIAQYPNGRKEISSTYVFISQDKYMRLLTICETVESNQRSYFRIETDIRSKIFYEFFHDRPLPLTEPAEIHVLNISLGGFLFESESDLKLGKTYGSNIVLRDTAIDVIFKIVRKSASENCGNIYACMFQNISSKLEKDICRYIFNSEKQKRAGIKNIF